MADAQTNNPAGEPPVEAGSDAPSSDDILAVFDLGDTKSAADKIAGETPATDPQTAAASPAEPGAAGAETAPAPAVTPPAGSEAPATPAAPAPAPAQPSAAPAAPSAAPETPAAAPQPGAAVVDERALREASLAAQVDALTRQLEEVRASPQPTGTTPQPAAETGQQQPPTVPFKYGLTLPEPVQQMLLSDDPAKNVQAIQAIVNDLGTIVHHSVVSQVRQEMQGVIQGLLQQASQTAEGDTRQQAMESAREDYYKAFPDHKNPLLLPIIQAEAQKMGAEFPHLQWGEQYINALGVRVNNYVSSLTGQAPQPTADPTPQPAPTTGAPPKQPAPFLPSGPRSADVTASGDLSETIVDVLDPFEQG